jgi:serine/threonine protein phosphatase PrpC
MSRSLGDKIVHTVGVLSVPEEQQYVLDKNDKFIVIASDGVWEFLTNQEVANIALPFF